MSTNRLSKTRAIKNVSETGIKHIILSYRADKNGAVANDWKPQSGFMYVAVRSISARVNQNFDAWPSEELKKSYKTFIGKPIFCNHNNFDPSRARGKVVAARYVESGDDRYVETIMEVDAQRFPKLARELREGGLDSVSMGVEAGLTKCSICGNKATDEPQFCDHVKHSKGQYLKDTRTGERKLCYEDCFKLGFFELSFVFDPADETAVVSRVMVANKTSADRRKDELLDIGESNSPMGGPDSTDYSQYVTQTPAVSQTQSDSSVSAPSSYQSAPSSSGGSSGGGSNYTPSGGVEQWRDEVNLALQHNNLPTSYADQVLHQVQTESSGNPNAINLTDSNAQAGHPSQGLLQTIPSTFDHYKLPGAKGITDPQSNLDAAVNYAKDTYGPTLVNDKGNGLGSGHGYDQGGFLPEGDTLVHNDTGAPELVIPLKGEFSPFDPDFEEAPTKKGQRVAMRKGAPFAGYDDFEDCEEQNADKDDSAAYCGEIKHRTEDKKARRLSYLEKLAYGETEAPEDVDTLRDDEDDSLDDYDFVESVNTEEDENPFQHYLKSPPELTGPHFDDAMRLDRKQETDGLDADRRVEDFGDINGDPEFEDAPPRRKTMPRTRTRRSAADDEAVEALEEVLEEDLAEDLDGDHEKGEPEEHQNDSDDDDSGDDSDDSDDDESDDDDSDDDKDDSDDDSDKDDDSDDDDKDVPAFIAERQATRRPVRNRSRAGKRGQATRGATMSLADRAKVAAKGRRKADTSGHTDGGPFGDDASQGQTEEAYLSEVPDSEAVVAPTPGDPTISNTENNLVARIKAKSADLQRDINAYQQVTAGKRRPYRQTADFVISLPPAQRVAAAQSFAATFKAENPKFSPAKFFAAVGLRLADAVEEPTKVDPPLSGTDDQSVAGDDFDSVALDDVETQPKDASVKTFAAFDKWLRDTTGKTASQHSVNFTRRQAARWAQHKGVAVEALYPGLANALRQARKGMKHRAEDTSLEVAAPQGRVDVEAPVANQTDADAQGTYDLGDFGHNAGDDLADPELSSDSQIWAPGEGDKTARKANGVAAVRYAEAVIGAGLAPAGDRWKLASQAETMRHDVVHDRTKLLEAVNNASRQVSAAVSRAPRNPLPPGITAAARTASTRRVADNDQANDAALFI